MIHTAKELLAKLRHLTLVGQNKEGELEWVGTDKQWKNAQMEVSLNDLKNEN